MAGRNNSERSNFEDLLHCLICFDSFNNPKMLKCGHTFCAGCIQGYYVTYQQQRRAQPGKLPCPICRELTTLPPGGVSALRNDFKVAKIEEMFKTVNIRDRKASKMCEPCRAQKKNMKAKVYCGNCVMNYCDSCFKKHNKNSLFKDHQVTEKATDSSAEFFCKVHKEEQGKYFCKTCETVVCTLCVMHDHEDHNVTEISAMYRRQQEDVKNLNKIVQSKVHNLRKQARDLETLRQLNLNSCQQAELTIKERTRQLVEMLKQEEAEMLRDLRTKRDTKLEKITKEVDMVAFRINKASSMEDFASSTAKKNSLRMMALHEELIQRMRTVADVDASSMDPEISSVITFLPARQDPQIGRIEEVSGTVDDLNRSRMVVSPLPPRQRSTSMPNGDMDDLHKPVMLINVHKFGTGAGELRDPLAVACLLSGDIVVGEWGNKRLQVFDSVGQHVTLIGAGLIGPQGVTVTLKGNILISDANQKRLQVFRPSGDSLTKWGLGKFYAPCGVAVSPNGNVVVTDVSEHAVSIFQGEQRCMRRIGSRGKKMDQFDNPLYVTTGPHNEVIVSDSNNHCLKVFDSYGRFLRKVGTEGSGPGELKYPRGVCTDYDGNIVVADRNNDRVSQFSIYGQFIKHLLTKENGIKDPYAVAVSITKNLVVTEGGENKASLKMFQLFN